MSHEVDEARDILRWATGRSSIRRVAEDLGIDHTVVARFLSGKAQKPRADVLARLLPYVARRRPEYEAHRSATGAVTGAATTTGGGATTAGEARVVYPPAYSDGMMAAAEQMSRTLTAIIAEARQHRAGTELPAVWPQGERVTLPPREESERALAALRAQAEAREAATRQAAESRPVAPKRRAGTGR